MRPVGVKGYDEKVVSLLTSIKKILIAILVFIILTWMSTYAIDDNLGSMHQWLKDIHQKIVMEGKEGVLKMLIKREGSFVNMLIQPKGEPRQNIPLRDVRGAVSWPSTKGSEMYFLIAAQKQEFGYTPRPPVVLVKEFSDIAPMRVFEQMVVLGKKYECGHFYADLRSKHDEHQGLFNEFSRYNRNSFVHLEPADLAGDFRFGVGIVIGWDKSLEVPKDSVLGRELAKVSSDNVDEGMFPAINALRLLLSSLEREPWVTPAARQMSPDPDKARRRWSVFT